MTTTSNELNGRQDREPRADHELRDDELDAVSGCEFSNIFQVFDFLPPFKFQTRVGGSEGGAFGLSRLKP
jgi:hypothetical protein